MRPPTATLTTTTIVSTVPFRVERSKDARRQMGRTTMVDEVEQRMEVDCLLARQLRCSVVVESRYVKSRLTPGDHPRSSLSLALVVDSTVAHVF
jgi:hypothetical protein